MIVSKEKGTPLETEDVFFFRFKKGEEALRDGKYAKKIRYNYIVLEGGTLNRLLVTAF